MSSTASHTSMVSTIRGVLITVGVVLLAFFQPASQSAAYSIVIGLAMQVIWAVALWLVRRYERNNQLQGTLQPTVVFILELLIDAISVALFADAVLRPWWQAGQAL